MRRTVRGRQRDSQTDITHHVGVCALLIIKKFSRSSVTLTCVIGKANELDVWDEGIDGFKMR